MGSYPTFSPLPDEDPSGGFFSVALSVTTRAVPRNYLAACPWSPDFPRKCDSRDRPASVHLTNRNIRPPPPPIRADSNAILRTSARPPVDRGDDDVTGAS